MNWTLAAETGKLKGMFDVNHIIEVGGLLLIAAIIFGESGMFVGFFFPGDTLLMAAGIFAAAGKLSLVTLLPVIALAAIIGDNLGYHIGKRYGRRLFRKPDGLLFRQEYVQRAEAFYEKYGSKAMLIAHFVPVVRTFAPAVAGVGHMNYRQFFIYDAIGDIAWAVSVTMVGYWFGSKVPNIESYILVAVAGVMMITLGPALYHVAQSLWRRRSARNTKLKAKQPEQEKGQ